MQRHIRCVKMDAGAARDSEIELVFNTHLASGYEFFQAISAGIHTIFVFHGDDQARHQLQTSQAKAAQYQPTSVMIGPQGPIEHTSPPGAGPSHSVGNETVRQLEERLLSAGQAYVDAQGRTVVGTPPGQGV